MLRSLPLWAIQAREEDTMHRRSFVLLAAWSLLLVGQAPTVALANDDYHISAPIVHENLAIYFVQGVSSGGRAPLTLEEALAAKKVRVYETGDVMELTIENLGDEEVFVQSGDIVKGGQQDRALTVSLVLPPHSPRLAIEAFCVEHDRWSKRGNEDVRQFSSAAAAVPSREAKLAIQSGESLTSAVAGEVPGTNVARLATADRSARQTQVWHEVARVQSRLSHSVGEPVASPQSQTSLQLALENDKLKQVQKDYIAALQPAGEQERDTIGYVFAVNGKLNSAEIYTSNALFRKMWPKLLTANATEAIAKKGDRSETMPSVAEVAAFLKDAEAGTASKRALTQFVELETRQTARALYFETRRSNGMWVHRSYLAK
jgi:hypothetical protein